jgi:hypothetical protein
MCLLHMRTRTKTSIQLDTCTHRCNRRVMDDCSRIVPNVTGIVGRHLNRLGRLSDRSPLSLSDLSLQRVDLGRVSPDTVRRTWMVLSNAGARASTAMSRRPLTENTKSNVRELLTWLVRQGAAGRTPSKSSGRSGARGIRLIFERADVTRIVCAFVASELLHN